MLILAIQVAAVLLHPSETDQIWLNHSPISFVAQSNGVARYYVITTTFYVIVWCDLRDFSSTSWSYFVSSRSSRFSILFSVIRIDPSKLRRPYPYFIGALFLLVCFFLVTQLFYVCTPQTSWREMKVPQCIPSTQVAICKLTCRCK